MQKISQPLRRDLAKRTLPNESARKKSITIYSEYKHVESVHDESEGCNKSELDLITVPPTQVTVAKSVFVDYYLVSKLGEDSGPIEFYVPGNDEDYLDPSRMQLYVKAKTKTAGGDNIGGTAAVGPRNLFLQSLFSRVNVSLNDKLITPSSSTYPYREIIDSKKNSKFWSSCEKITVNYEFVLQRYTWQNERS